MLEALEALLPVGPELARHAALDEWPAHRRRIGLKLHQLVDVFLGERVGDRREELRHLHQRPLDAAQRRLELGRMPAAVERQAEIALAREARRKAADRRRDLRVAADAAAERVAF